MSDGISRRRLLIEATSVLVALASGDLAWPALARASGGTAVARWLAGLQVTTSAVLRGRATTRAWRRRARHLTRRVPLADVLHVVDFDAKAAALDTIHDVEPQQRLSLAMPAGCDPFAFTMILSRIRPGFAVVPHGHHNMVSMHLVLAGAIRLRQYDRLRDGPGHLAIRPVADRVCGPGDATAISADRGNVHWLRPLTDAYALIVAAYDLAPAAGASGRDYVDPLGGEPLADGTIRAPILTEDDARRRYLAV